MSNLHKRLLVWGAPIASLLLLAYLFSGNRWKSPPAFEGIGEISLHKAESEDRYEVAAQPNRELTLPPVNLDFLATDLATTELMAATAASPAEGNAVELPNSSEPSDKPNDASLSEASAETETFIPLIPPVSSRNSANVSRPADVKMVTFENDSGNDFPLTPPTAEDRPGNSVPPTTAAALPIPAAPSSQQEFETVETGKTLPSAQQTHGNDDGHDLPSDQMLLANSTTLPPAISTQIRQRLEYGTSLARRGAFASAEEVYFQVIRLIAETKDTQLGAREHTALLAEGLTALEEAEDFISRDLRTRVRINVENIIQGHNTAILQDKDVSGMTSIQALQRYYEYASEMIAGACDNEPVGGEALYSLGKLYAADTQYDPTNSAMRNAKSMIMYQAALEADAMNYRAANELGVLLAQYGRFEDSKEMLIHSVATNSDQIAWKNLAVVHEKLGETQLAGLAFKESIIAAEQAERRTTAAANGPIQWVEPQAFVRAGGDPQEFVDAGTQQPSAGQRPPANSQDQKSPAGRTAKASPDWWKIWKR